MTEAGTCECRDRAHRGAGCPARVGPLYGRYTVHTETKDYILCLACYAGGHFAEGT